MKLPINYESIDQPQRRLVRLEYIKQQKGLCCHCKTDLTGPPSFDIIRTPVNKRIFPQSFFKWPVHLHHNRQTGMTIGAVHNRCNAVLWQYHNE